MMQSVEEKSEPIIKGVHFAVWGHILRVRICGSGSGNVEV